MGFIFGVATGDALSGAEVVLAVEGVYSLAKVSTDVIAVGDLVYWDNTAELVTVTVSTNMLIGVAVAVAANPSATVNVRLNHAFGA